MGKINVNIQKEDRLEAINNLSKAIYEVAKALTTPVNITISNNTIKATEGQPAINIQSQEEVLKEIIKEYEDNEVKFKEGE